MNDFIRAILQHATDNALTRGTAAVVGTETENPTWPTQIPQRLADINASIRDLTQRATRQTATQLAAKPSPTTSTVPATSVAVGSVSQPSFMSDIIDNLTNLSHSVDTQSPAFDNPLLMPVLAILAILRKATDKRQAEIESADKDRDKLRAERDKELKQEEQKFVDEYGDAKRAIIGSKKGVTKRERQTAAKELSQRKKQIVEKFVKRGVVDDAEAGDGGSGVGNALTRGLVANSRTGKALANVLSKFAKFAKPVGAFAALAAIPIALAKLSFGQKEANERRIEKMRHDARFSAPMAGALAEIDIRRMLRHRAAARVLSPEAVKFVEAADHLEHHLEPLEVAMENVGNIIGRQITTFADIFVKYGTKQLETLPLLGQYLKDIKEELKRQQQEGAEIQWMMPNQFINNLVDPNDPFQQRRPLP